MKTSLQVYLMFNGICEEALNCYTDIFNGTVEYIQRYSQAPMEVPKDYENKVMHASFKADEIFFMASDAMPDQPVNQGANVSLSLDFKDEKDQERIFNAFVERGSKVTMPLEDVFWGARFGTLTDPFGVHWMFNYDKR